MKATMSLLNKSFIKRNIYQGLPCHIDPLKVRSEVEAALMFLILNLIQQKKKQRYFDQDRFLKKKVSWNQQDLFISVNTVCEVFWIQQLRDWSGYHSLYKWIIVKNRHLWYILVGLVSRLTWAFQKEIVLQENYFKRVFWKHIYAVSEFLTHSHFSYSLLFSSLWLLHPCFPFSLH